jgi:GGDEF domain-containing protein
MTDLKNSVLVLFVYIFAIFGVAQIDFVEQNLINFEPVFFILVALAVLSALVVVPFTNLSIYQFLIFWAAIYTITRIIYWQVTTVQLIQIIILEFVLIEIAAGLAFEIGRQLRQVSRLVDKFTAITYPNRTLDLRTAGDRISTELTRSRRYSRPLSLLVVQMDKLEAQQVLEKDESLQRDILTRFAAARIGQIVNDQARENDLILRDSENRFILICPETEQLNSTILAQRISRSAAEIIGAKVRWGVSSFPDEALTFDDLVEKAAARLSEELPDQASVSVEDRQLYKS